MCSEVGWKHFDLIKALEAARKVKSAAFYTEKKQLAAKAAKAAKA